MREHTLLARALFTGRLQFVGGVEAKWHRAAEAGQNRPENVWRTDQGVDQHQQAGRAAHGDSGRHHLLQKTVGQSAVDGSHRFYHYKGHKHAGRTLGES